MIKIKKKHFENVCFNLTELSIANSFDSEVKPTFIAELMFIGSVFIYYGRSDMGVSSEHVQVLKASKQTTPLVYFGYSIDASQDVDGNGYNGKY